MLQAARMKIVAENELISGTFKESRLAFNMEV
jgi:hypothetical protein